MWEEVICDAANGEGCLGRKQSIRRRTEEGATRAGGAVSAHPVFAGVPVARVGAEDGVLHELRVQHPARLEAVLEGERPRRLRHTRCTVLEVHIVGGAVVHGVWKCAMCGPGRGDGAR